MKKTVKTLAFAIAIMGLTMACNNNQVDELVDSLPVIDTTPVVVEEPVVDTPAVVVEEPVAKPAPAKKATKKATPKKTEPAKKEVNDASKMTASSEKGVTVNKNGIKLVNGDKGNAAVDASKMTINTSKGTATASGEGLKIAVKN